MNKSKFSPLSFKAINENEKYLPGLDPGFPLPNEILEFMDCLSSTSYKENVKKGKVNHNESEIGFKILLAMLPFRNVFPGAYASLENIQTYCNGYSLKSIRKGAEWLVSKGLFLPKKGKCNRNEYNVNYTGLSYEEIVSDITRQLEDGISKEKIVFKGIRYLTTTQNKKAGDNKSTGNFTRIPFFPPEAKGIEINGEIEWQYVRNGFFDSLDGNTLKVILQLAYKQHFNFSKKGNPLTRIKIDTLKTLCNVSRNKVLQAMAYLKGEGFLRAYNVKRNIWAYLFNFKTYRLAKVTRDLEKRRKKQTQRPIKVISSFTVSGLHNGNGFTFSESLNEEVLPSQDCINKNLNLNKIKESFKKDVSSEQDSFSKTLEEILKDKNRREELVSKEEFNENLSTQIKQDPQKQIYEQIKKELLSDFRNLIIDYRLFNSLVEHLDFKRKQREELYSKDELIKSFSQLQSRDYESPISDFELWKCLHEPKSEKENHIKTPEEFIEHMKELVRG